LTAVPFASEGWSDRDTTGRSAVLGTIGSPGAARSLTGLFRSSQSHHRTSGRSKWTSNDLIGAATMHVYRCLGSVAGDVRSASKADGPTRKIASAFITRFPPEGGKREGGKRDRSDIDKMGCYRRAGETYGLLADAALCDFRRAADWSISRFESESFGNLFLPEGTPEWTASLDAPAERFEFLLRLRLVHPIEPVRLPTNGPIGQQRLLLFRPVNAPPETRPTPLFRSQHQIGSQRVPLDVAGHNPEMLVGLDGEGLVSALVDVPQSHVMPMLLPAADVRDRQPLHEGRQVAVVLGPKQEMPMIRHHRVGTNPHGRLVSSFLEDPFERLKVSRLVEQLHAAHAAIQNMKHHPTRCDPRCSWHDRGE